MVAYHRCWLKWIHFCFCLLGNRTGTSNNIWKPRAILFMKSLTLMNHNQTCLFEFMPVFHTQKKKLSNCRLHLNLALIQCTMVEKADYLVNSFFPSRLIMSKLMFQLASRKETLKLKQLSRFFFFFKLAWSGWSGPALSTYEGCSKWIAYFCLETSNFKLAQKYSFHALEVLPVARNAKFQPMYPLLEGVTVRWFGHSNKVLMNGRSKCLSGLVFPPSKECFQFRKQKEITWGKVWGIRGVRQNSYFFLLQKRCNYCGGMSWGIVM